jgi:hypothetical protein
MKIKPLLVSLGALLLVFFTMRCQHGKVSSAPKSNQAASTAPHSRKMLARPSDEDRRLARLQVQR